MEVIEGSDNFARSNPGVIIGLGNFDGIHLGHQQVIKTVVNQAKASGLCSLSSICFI